MTSVSETDRQIMGTPEAAKAALIEKTKAWRELRQPSIATRGEHRKTEIAEHQARFQLANAAALWLWHEENPALTAALSDQVVVPRDVYVDLLKAVTDEVNEKGAGEYLLARLHDARKFAAPPPASAGDDEAALRAVGGRLRERSLTGPLTAEQAEDLTRRAT